jgi:hypothetical protein
LGTVPSFTKKNLFELTAVTVPSILAGVQIKISEMILATLPKVCFFMLDSNI